MDRRGEIKKSANKLEKQLADYLGGWRIPASGSIDCMKGDIDWGNYLIDSKNTEKSTIPLLAKDLGKIFKEGREADKTGHLILSFLEEDYHWAVVPKVDCDFESYEQTVLANKSKSISKSLLATLERKSFKAGKIPSIKVHFKNMLLGVPRVWLILPLKNYKNIFGVDNE